MLDKQEIDLLKEAGYEVEIPSIRMSASAEMSLCCNYPIEQEAFCSNCGENCV